MTASSQIVPDSSARVGINGQLLSTEKSYRSAGVSGYIRQLLRHLPATAPDIRFTAFVSGTAAGLPESIHAHHTDAGRPWRRILWEQLVLPTHCRRYGLNLLHSTVNISPVVLPCPAVVTVHDLSFLRYPQAFPPAQRLYLHTQVRRSIRSAQLVIAVSEATRQDIITLLGVAPERVKVVYNGVDERFGPGEPAAIEAFRQQRKLPPRFVLHLGTLEPRKNLVRLIQAFNQVLRRNGDRDGGSEKPHLVLAGGKGWNYDTVFQEIEALQLHDYVHFAGYVPDSELVWWYRAAAVFAYPSLLEGFGLPVVEAMACGTPTITSNVSSLPEVAGEAGLLVDPTSVDSLADALRRALEDTDLAQDLRQRGPRQSSKFSWRATAQGTAAVYRQALGLANAMPESASANLSGEHIAQSLSSQRSRLSSLGSGDGL